MPEASTRALFSYWHQGALRRTDWVCVESWLQLGFDVTIFSHDPDVVVPAGARVANADEVLSASYQQGLVPLRDPSRARWQPLINYSDLFRIAGIAQGRGLWLDTDVFLLSSFEIDRDRPMMGWEGFRRIGSPVLYLPPGSAMIGEYQRAMADLDQTPSWVEWRKASWRPLRWRLRGLPYRPTDLGITIYGNYAFTRLGRKYYGRRDILPKARFYHWTGSETQRFYQDPDGEAALRGVGAWGIHVHRKGLNNAAPVSGSLFDRALKASSFPT